MILYHQNRILVWFGFSGGVLLLPLFVLGTAVAGATNTPSLLLVCLVSIAALMLGGRWLNGWLGRQFAVTARSLNPDHYYVVRSQGFLVLEQPVLAFGSMLQSQKFFLSMYVQIEEFDPTDPDHAAARQRYIETLRKRAARDRNEFARSQSELAALGIIET